MNIRIPLVIISLVVSVLIGLTFAKGGARRRRTAQGRHHDRPVARHAEGSALAGGPRHVRQAGRRARRRGARPRREQRRHRADQRRREADHATKSTCWSWFRTTARPWRRRSPWPHEAGIPVIAYDRIIRDSDLDLYVSFDNVHVGELQAQFLVEHLPRPGKGRIVRIYGAKTDNNAAHVQAGPGQRARALLIDRGDIEVVHEDWAEDWKPENAKRIVNAAITAQRARTSMRCSPPTTAPRAAPSRR